MPIVPIKPMKKLNTILLVDDDEISHFINSAFIKKTNLCDIVETAIDGQEALRYLSNCFTNNLPYPDLIFLDLKMPVMDGFEFLELFHQIHITSNTKVIIIILTSSDNPYDKEKVKKYSKVRDYITKPLTTEKFEKIYNTHFS
jgi:CheY-like chemotaxis protein